MHRIICVIPARLDSSRFPKKMLAPLAGKPLVQWAYEGAKACHQFSDLVVATDSREIERAVTAFGGKAVMTSASCRSGTERLVELQSRGILEGDIWVNWQGDEPFVGQQMIAELLQSIDRSDEWIWTLKKRIIDSEQIASTDVVKVVTDCNGRALYFSRSPIPYSGETYKHVGLYAYRSCALRAISALPPCPLEEAERLEQLRFLYHGLPITVHRTEQESLGIDTEKEMVEAEEAVRRISDLVDQLCGGQE